MEKNISYFERMKKRKEIIDEMDKMSKNIDDLKKQVDGIEKKISDFKEKLKNVNNELNEKMEEKKKLEESYLKSGIPVPEDGGFEISNGMIGMNRDINIKLTYKLDDHEVRQVFIYYFEDLIDCLKDIWNRFRILYLEKLFLLQAIKI
jgi:hypothetical protein